VPGDLAIVESPTPIQIEATPRQGFSGLPPDYFDGTISLMSPRLVKALTGAGVHNLSLYPAIITYTTTREWHEVFAFNLVGLVSVAPTA